MEALDAAWEQFLCRAGSEETLGGAAGAEFEGYGPVVASAAGPAGVTVGSLCFFPRDVREDVSLPADSFLIAQSETRAFVLDGTGKITEVHFGGGHPIPFSFVELLDLARPFAGLQMQCIGETRFLAPEREASMRDELGAKFDIASDLFGVPLLKSARSELESRIRGTRVLFAVALVLLLGILLIASAMSTPLVMGVVALSLGCIPVTLVALGARTRTKASQELSNLPAALLFDKS